MTDLDAAYARCEAQLRDEDPDGWLAALLAPAAARRHLHAIGAFALEVGHVRARVRQPIAGEIRLQWWQDAVDGARGAEAAAHPVAAALLDTMARAELPAAPIADMLDAHRLALYDAPPADLPTLARGLAAVRGTPMRLAARVLGAGPEADAAADEAGVAVGIADLLDDLRSGRRTGLPTALLERRGAGQADAAAARATPEMRAALADLRAEARDRLSALRARRGALGFAAPAVLRAALVEPRLEVGERAADPFAPQGEIPRWRRQWRLWRAARRGGAL